MTQLPGGLLALKFGGKNVFGLGVLCGAFATLLMPFAARVHVGFLIALQVVSGLSQVRLCVSFMTSKSEIKCDMRRKDDLAHWGIFYPTHSLSVTLPLQKKTSKQQIPNNDVLLNLPCDSLDYQLLISPICL